MSKTLEQTTSITLNTLITTLKDGEVGFASAAENVTRSELKDFFRSSCQRSEFAQALNRQVRHLH